MRVGFPSLLMWIWIKKICIWKNVWKSESFYIYYMRKEVESLNLDYRFNNLS